MKDEMELWEREKSETNLILAPLISKYYLKQKLCKIEKKDRPVKFYINIRIKSLKNRVNLGSPTVAANFILAPLISNFHSDLKNCNKYDRIEKRSLKNRVNLGSPAVAANPKEMSDCSSSHACRQKHPGGFLFGQ